jgi:hypothetical protein
MIYHRGSFFQLERAFIDTANKFVEVFKMLLHLGGKHHVDYSLSEWCVLIPTQVLKDIDRVIFP